MKCIFFYSYNSNYYYTANRGECQGGTAHFAAREPGGVVFFFLSFFGKNRKKH